MKRVEVVSVACLSKPGYGRQWEEQCPEEAEHRERREKKVTMIEMKLTAAVKTLYRQIQKLSLRLDGDKGYVKRLPQYEGASGKRTGKSDASRACLLSA